MESSILSLRAERDVEKLRLRLRLLFLSALLAFTFFATFLLLSHSTSMTAQYAPSRRLFYSYSKYSGG
jgi:uncharacterized protein (UPF0333 family)